MTKHLTSLQVMELKGYIDKEGYLANDGEKEYMLEAIEKTLETLKVSEYQISLIVER